MIDHSAEFGATADELGQRITMAELKERLLLEDLRARERMPKPMTDDEMEFAARAWARMSAAGQRRR